MKSPLRVACFAQAGLLLLAWPVAAQVRLGELSTSGNGTISSGYSATYGNMTDSSHSWIVGGAATLTGSFYNPNFLSYNASIYLNQSRANSNFQSISNASGFNLSANIFGGSNFPGSISYSKAYDSEGNYAVPGLANFVTHGNSDTFGINWSENLPDAPSFSAGFQMGSSHYTVYGTNDLGENKFHSLNLHSAYKLTGFQMGAFYTKGGGHSVIPQMVAGFQSTETHSDNDTYGFNATHLLPLQGSFSFGVNRSDWKSDYLGFRTSGAIDMFNASVAVRPTNKLSLSTNADYSDNLMGQVIEQVVAASTAVPALNSDQTSNSLDIMSIASYNPVANLQTSVFFERRTQNFMGENYGVKSYGGNATYAHGLLNGTINTAVTVTANSSDNTNGDTLGFSANENYSNEIMGWHITESFGYSQNAQTLLVTYMNSFYNYAVSARHRWGEFNISAGAGGARTALTQVAGTTNTSETYNASMGYGAWITATGSYSKSSGQALATGAGLVPVPVPLPILPSDLVALFGGDSYSFGVSSTPVKKLTMAAAYAKSASNTSTSTFASANQNNQLNVLVQYQYRKLNFTSGTARLEQSFTASGLPPEVISSFYVGVSRWFNFL